MKRFYGSIFLIAWSVQYFVSSLTNYVFLKVLRRQVYWVHLRLSVQENVQQNHNRPPYASLEWKKKQPQIHLNLQIISHRAGNT